MYQKQMYLALVGVGICALPIFIPLVPKVGVYIESERIKAETQLKAQKLKTSEEFERNRIDERAKTSEKLYQSGVLPSTRNLRINRYIDSSKLNPKPDTTIYQDDEIVEVFDTTGRCIGRIEEGVWKWKYKHQGICKGVQNIKSIREVRNGK